MNVEKLLIIIYNVENMKKTWNNFNEKFLFDKTHFYWMMGLTTIWWASYDYLQGLNANHLQTYAKS